MEFLNPAALYGLLALPLLLIPYLIRRKTRRVPFSSLLLLNEASAQLRTRPWGHLRLPLLFFLQLLLLALLVFALAEPVFTTLPSHVAIVLDNSASMQATEDGGTRFQLAQEKARSVLGGVAAGGQVDIYTTTPRLQRVAAASFSPREAAQAMNSLTPYDLGDPPVDYRSALARLAQANRYERVFLITDHPSRGQNEILRVTTVGTAKANLAMTSLRVRQPALANSSTEASFEVSNYSSKDERVRVLLRGGGKVLGSRELSVPAGKSAAGTVESLPSYPSYEAEIENRDALALDNRRFAVAPGSAKLRILAVSPRPQELATLKSVPGISLDVIAPDDYEKTEHSAYGLEIFHFAAPSILPRTPALLILPPDGNDLVEAGAPITRPAISGWRDAHVLTRYVNFALFRPAYARPLKPKIPANVVMESPQGALALAIERRGTRQLILGFDPFPYLGRDNLPMSIFTLNFIDWFSREWGGNDKATGEPLIVGPADQAKSVVTPKGNRPLRNSTVFPDTYFQGIYEIPHGSEKVAVAVNLQDTGESDLRSPAVIDLSGNDSGSGRLQTLISYWPYLLLAALALLLLEWFAHPRRVVVNPLSVRR